MPMFVKNLVKNFLRNKLKDLTFWLFLLIIFFAKTAASEGVSLSPYIINFNQEELMTLQLTLVDEEILSESISGYKSGNVIFVSLRDLMAGLEFDIKISEDGSKAEGVFLEENKKFKLDLRENLVASGNKSYELNPKDVKLFEKDLFVNIDVLEKWFSLDIIYDSLKQLIKINPIEPLPIQIRASRAKRQQILTQNKLNNLEESATNLKPVTAPYKLFGEPFADAQYNYRHNKGSDGDKSQFSELNIMASQDLLYLSSRLDLIMRKDDLHHISIAAGRTDNQGNLLGPLHATRFQAGDLYMAPVPLLTNGQVGRGISISNYKGGYVTNFNTVPIRGIGQTGWQVELYRNNILLDFQNINERGEYDFPRVPLLIGLNTIKLIFYGPFGRRYEQTRSFLVGNELIKKGKLYYRYTAQKHNRYLIVLDRDEDHGRDLDNYGERRYYGEFQYGLTDNSSLALAYTRIPLEEVAKQEYLTASLRSFVKNIYNRLDLIKQKNDSQHAAQWSAQTTVKNYNLLGRYTQLSEGFVSEENPASTEPMIKELYFKADGPLPVPYLLSLNLSSALSKQYFNSGNDKIDFSNSLSFNVGRRLALTQTIDYIKDGRIEDTSQGTSVTGNTIANYNSLKNLNLRFNAAYQIKPVNQMSSASITATYKWPRQITSVLIFNRQFGSQTLDSYTLNLGKTFDKYILALGTQYDSNKAYQVSFNVLVSFAGDATNNIYKWSPSMLATSGAAVIKVFVDTNNNGVYDEGEELLPDIGFKISGRIVIEKTNQKGIAFITNLPTDDPTIIEIKASDLSDPAFTAPKSRVAVTTHAGGIAEVNFPIVLTGEIEGMAELIKDNKRVPASNVILELVDKNGQVINTSTSSYDGYYFFDNVILGKYQLRVAPKQMARLNLGSNNIYNFELTKDNLSKEFDFLIGPSSKKYTSPEKEINKFKLFSPSLPAQPDFSNSGKKISKFKIKSPIPDKDRESKAVIKKFRIKSSEAQTPRDDKGLEKSKHYFLKLNSSS